jgi:hypothetical protein
VCVVLLLLVLIISVVVLYIKHRRIYSAYSQVTPPTNCVRARPGFEKLTHSRCSLQLKEASESDMELEMVIDGEDFPDN